MLFCSFHQLFTDGTTNKLVGCYTEDDPEDMVLVRVYGHKTELIVDRDQELKSFQVAKCQQSRMCFPPPPALKYLHILCMSPPGASC